MNRSDFSLLVNNKDIIYFDNGATTLKPKCVIDSIDDYYNNYSVNVHRGEYDLSFKADEIYNEARENVAKFINAKSNEIIFTSGTTDSINFVVDGFMKSYLHEGDEVLITYAEHASNVLPWFNLVNDIHIKVSYIPLDSNYHVTLDNVKKSITKNTKVISLAGITNVIGDVRPIKEICILAHKNNILVLEDGAQSVPHMKCDVKDSDVDFLCFSGHKMCGPTGIGVLYIKESLEDKLKPVRLGGGMNESFDSPSDICLKDAPIRYEAGTPNIAGIIGLNSAVKYLSSIGMDKIHEHECMLKTHLVKRLKEYKYIKLLNNINDSGIVSFNIDNIFSQDVGYYLNKYHICVRTGNHCAKILKYETNVTQTVRVSLYFYNTIEEIDKLCDLLSDYDKIRKEMII